MDGNDIGMVQRRRGLRFLNKPASAFRLAGVRRREYFDRDEPVQTSVLGLKNLTHPARSEPFYKLILPYRSPNHTHSGSLQFVTVLLRAGNAPLPVVMARKPFDLAHRRHGTATVRVCVKTGNVSKLKIESQK